MTETLKEKALAAIEDFIATNDILIRKLSDNDEDGAYEAISVMLMQVFQIYGPESAVMRQLFPVMGIIEKFVSSSNLKAALAQTLIFEKQLHEIRTLILQG
jgi:hypothetical protein